AIRAAAIVIWSAVPARNSGLDKERLRIFRNFGLRRDTCFWNFASFCLNRRRSRRGLRLWQGGTGNCYPRRLSTATREQQQKTQDRKPLHLRAECWSM